LKELERHGMTHGRVPPFMPAITLTRDEGLDILVDRLFPDLPSAT
jgi:hypothetical protein